MSLLGSEYYGIFTCFKLGARGVVIAW